MAVLFSQSVPQNGVRKQNHGLMKQKYRLLKKQIIEELINETWLYMVLLVCQGICNLLCCFVISPGALYAWYPQDM